jgi:hypothetical protein
MKQAKLIISTVIVLMAVASGAKAAATHASPASCDDYNGEYVDGTGISNWTVNGCSGGSVDGFAGISFCSSSSGSYAKRGDPSMVGGRYCWCALTKPAASAWVFRYDYGSADGCPQVCATYCAHYARGHSEFRSALFSAIGS